MAYDGQAHIFDFIPTYAHGTRPNPNTNSPGSGILGNDSDYDASTDIVRGHTEAGYCKYPRGTIEAEHIDLPSHSTLDGTSHETIFHQISGTNNRPGSVDGLFTLNYTNNATPTKNVTFRNLQLRCDPPVAAYEAGALDEKQHLVVGGHTQNVVFDNVLFYGWRGDAVFMGSQMSGVNVPTDYVAEGTYFKNGCEFDGINNKNRQAITLGSVNGVYGDGIKIRYTTNANMPGAICVEPELPWAYAMNIHFKDARIYAIGPEGARRPAMVVDTGNLDDFYASRRGAITLSNSYLGDTDGVHVKGKRIRSFTMDNNEIDGTQTKSLLLSIDDLVYINNKLRNCQPLQLGYTGADIYRVTTGGNTFYRSNGPEGAIQVHTVHGGEISRDNFVHCGHPSARAAVTLAPNGSSGVKIHHHDFRSPYEDRCDYGVRQYSTHTMWPGSGNHDNIGVGSIIPYYVG